MDKSPALHAQATSSSSATGDLTHVSYPQELLILARKLIGEERYSVAVVVAHMACEVATERSLPSVTKPNGYNLANDRTRKLYTAWTRDEVQKAPFWHKFKESADRRNAVVHAGRRATKTEAEDTCTVVESLLAHLKQ
jgi:hypothetical protein